NGNNGYPAGPGYDLTGGLGTPVANLLVPDLAAYQLPSNTASATDLIVTASPPAPVFGQAVTLTATVGVVSPGTGMPTGTVTFEQGSTILGTATLVNGVAELTTTPSAAGTETITIAYSGNDQPVSIQFPLTVAKAAATLGLGNLIFAFDGSPHTAAVTTGPAGLSGVTVIYSQNGAAVTRPTQAGDYTVTATLNNADYTATPVTGTLVIGQAAPTPTPTPPPAMIIGEQPVFQRRVRKDGKPFGKAVLTGFTLDFNVSLGAAAATNPANYQLDNVR